VNDRLLDAGEVAELLHVPVRWVREATRAGKLPCVALGKYRRYDRGDVLAWVETQKGGGAAMAFRKHRPVPGGGTK
jgi:excisionase family DNA binding protein